MTVKIALQKHILPALVLLFLSALSACPDPCLIPERSCNEDRDCEAGKHCVHLNICRHVKGLCDDLDVCETAADCREGECCDQQAKSCAPNGACTPTCEEGCSGQSICASDTQRCRPNCQTDGEIKACEQPGTLCTPDDYCSLPIGTPCEISGGKRGLVPSCGAFMECKQERVVSGCTNIKSEALHVSLSTPDGHGYCVLDADLYQNSCGPHEQDPCPDACPAGSCYVETSDVYGSRHFCYPPEPH